MTAKDSLKNLTALFALFFTGISASAAIFFYFEDTFPLLNRADFPENPAAYALGGYLGAVFGVILSLFITVTFFVLIFSLHQKIRLSLLFFQKNETIACKIFRSIGYALAAWFVYRGIRDWIVYKTFFINGLWYYASAVAFVAMGILIFESILTQDTDSSDCSGTKV